MKSVCALLLLPALALAVPPRSMFTLPSSNGHGAVLVDVTQAKVTHWREQLPATQEPLLDAQGHEVWNGNQLQVVTARDLLFDSYFGLRVGGQQAWLTSTAPISSDYAAAAPSPRAGSGIVTFSQTALGVQVTTWVFAPLVLGHTSYVKVLCAKNTTTTDVTGVTVFTLENHHLGFGRPGVMAKLGATGETIVIDANQDVLERGFAGVVVTRPLGTATPTAWNGTTPQGQNGFFIVQSTTGDFPTRAGDQGVHDDSVSGFQFTLGTLTSNSERCIGTVSAHHGDPFAGAQVQTWLDAYVGTSTARALLDAELTRWSAFQGSLTLPAGRSADEDVVLRQSAAILKMAQVTDGESYLRDSLSHDGEPRFTRFHSSDGGSALPALVSHRGQGAVLASLPPGEWTYAWVRDGAYASAAMSSLGLVGESREALRFVLDAEGGRFQTWTELQGYGLPPYLPSLVRYEGFGVEETDFNAYGPNLEFDGFGLLLWALREHELRTQDTSLVDARWNDIATRVADPVVALIDPATGLLRPDSSIWESHWNGRQRTWSYTNLVAARGLCDAAALAQRRGDSARVVKYRDAALSLRRAIAQRLVDAQGALASNAEELAAGHGYFDVAVAEAVSMGLFSPTGRIAVGTLDAFDGRLRVDAGPGWSRNDDRVDHPGSTDLSPWGSDYDSAEWVFTDLRGALALRAAGRTARADALLDWTTQQAVANAALIPETYDETTGAWKFNAPMVGFGAGAYVLALAQRGDAGIEPACGAYFEDEPVADGGAPALDAGSGGDAGTLQPTADSGVRDAGHADAGVTPPVTRHGCGCSSFDSFTWLWSVALVAAVVARSRRPRRAPCAPGC